MKKQQKAFTLLELVFVIVVIGILSVVAVPKLAPIISDAKMAKARDTLSSVRSALATERQKKILRGSFSQIGDLGGTFSGTSYAFAYFDNNASRPVLEYPIENCASATATSCWNRVDATHYVYKFSGGGDAKYKLDKSRLVCDSDAADCKKLLP